jgi:Mor transcription activator family
MLKPNDIIPLPLTAQVIARVIGRDAALVLASKCKHRHLYIPKNEMPNHHFLVRTIGRNLADRLQKAFRGELLPFARCRSVFLAKRDAEIRAARLSGKPHAVIAQEFQLSMKQVHFILHPEIAKRHRQRTCQRQRERRIAKRIKLSS